MTTGTITESLVTSPNLVSLNISSKDTVTFDFHGIGFKLYHASLYHQDTNGSGNSQLLLYLPASTGGGAFLALLQTGAEGPGPDGVNYPMQFVDLPFCMTCPIGTKLTLNQGNSSGNCSALIQFDYTG